MEDHPTYHNTVHNKSPFQPEQTILQTSLAFFTDNLQCSHLPLQPVHIHHYSRLPALNHPLLLDLLPGTNPKPLHQANPPINRLLLLSLILRIKPVFQQLLSFNILLLVLSSPHLALLGSFQTRWLSRARGRFAGRAGGCGGSGRVLLVLYNAVTGAERGGFGDRVFVAALAVPAVLAVLATARLTPRPNVEINRCIIRGSCGVVSRFCLYFCAVESAEYEV